MNVLAFLLAVVAVFTFLLAAFNARVRTNLIGLGLAVLTTSWIVESITAGRQIHT